MYLFIRSSTNPGPRVSRIIRYFEGKGKKIVYLAPYRKGDLPDPQHRDLGSLGEYDYFDGAGLRGYFMYVIGINWLVAKIIYRHRHNINFIHFSDLEVVLFGSIMCKALGIRFVYNIHDNFFQRYNVNRILALGLKYLESFFIRISDKTVVPELFRRTCYPEKLHSKIFVLRNYPDFDVSTSHIPFVNKSISLFYGGWISPNRSIGTFFELADALILKRYSVSFNICGWGDSNYLDLLAEIAARKKITFKYLGQLSQEDAVGYLKQADVSIAYYSPDKVINIFAASNKIPEIIGSSTILITNSHTEIAKIIKPLNISLQFDISVHEVVDELVTLIEDKALMTEFDMRAKKFYMAEYNPQRLSSDLEELFCEYV
jgi:glycosyltransferase involved in cell wall biosynthesis